MRSVLLLLLVPSVAWAQDDRESEMFGVETSSTATVAGEEPLLIAPPIIAAPASIDASRDILAIGGLIFLQLDTGLADYGAITVPGSAEGLKTTLASPSFFDVYLDARPNDRLRAYMRGRVGFDASAVGGTKSVFGQVVEPFTPQLEQAWIKLDVLRSLFVTVGREKVKFGVGRFWNPTDFVNRERLDALAGVTVFDRRPGVGLVKLHFPIESLGWNFYAIGTLDGAKSLDEPGAVLRAELLLGTTEIAISGAARKDNPQRVGLAVSTGIGWVDLKAEAAVAFNSKELFLRGSCNVAQAFTAIVPGATALPDSLGEAYERSDEALPQIVAGAEIGIPIGDEDTLYFGGEYFYNGTGYEDATYYPCLIARPVLAGQLGMTGKQPTFSPFYLGQHYVGGYAFIQSPGRWDDTAFFLSGLANLSDQTGVVRFDFRQVWLTYLSFNAYVTTHLGTGGGEYAFSFRLPPSVMIPQPLPAGAADLLRDGVPRAVLEAGVGLQVAF